MKLSVIVPAYNEGETIGHVLDNIQKVDLSELGACKEIIVVDDGSLDGTKDEVLRFKDVKLIEHPINRGKGAAIRTGLAHASGDIILIQDADLEYDPTDYSKLLSPIVVGKAKVVYGSRFRNKWYPKRMRFTHFIGNKVLTFLTNLLYRAGITDEATCYKVFTSDLIHSINLRCEEFEFCPEVTAKIRKKGVSIYEVPISYSARTKAEGKKIAWQDGLQTVKALIKYRFTD